MIKKGLIGKIALAGLGIAAVSTYIAYEFSKDPYTSSKQSVHLSLDKEFGVEKIERGVCLNEYFPELNFAKVEAKVDNWNKKDQEKYDFKETTEPAKGSIAISTASYKDRDGEDIKARIEGALTKGNSGFAFTLSIWNDSGTLKVAQAYTLLNKNQENKWEIKRSFKTNEDTGTQTGVTNSNKSFYLLNNQQSNAIGFYFDVDVNNLCKVDCKSENYNYRTVLFDWNEDQNGRDTFKSWNTNTNSVETLIDNSQENAPKLAELYFNTKGTWTRRNSKA